MKATSMSLCVHYLCPRCQTPTSFPARDVKAAVDTGMRLVCSACRSSYAADQYLEVKETRGTHA